LAGLHTQILIFEDDSTLGLALKKAFEKEGFVAYLTSNLSEAKAILDKNPIGTLVVDCLLPEISGVEFVESIRGKYPVGVLDVILMSGILGDPAFIKESLRTVSGKHFLKKPFELSKLISLVEKPVAPGGAAEVLLNPRMALYHMFGQKKMTAREKRKAIEALDEIYGFDLPFIYSLIVESQISGNLNLIAQKGDVFGIYFSGGNITGVDIPDKETYLGKLLVERGFLHPEDLIAATQDKSNRRFGEKLTSGFMVSPHAIDIALTLQMSVRLSRTIVDQKVSVNLVSADVELTNPHIDADTFAEFLHDWIVAKISIQWLRAQYIQWMEFSLVKTPTFRDNHPALRAPVVQALPNFVKDIGSGLTLSQLIDSQKYAEEPFYKAIHYLLTRGLLVFAKSERKMSSLDRMKHFNKIYRQFTDLNKIEIFDLINQMVAGGQGTPDFVLAEFNRFIGQPPSAEEKELSVLHQQLSNLAQNSIEFAKSGNREKLKEDMAKSEIEQKMQASQHMEEAKNHLQKSSFKLGLELLQKVQKVDPKTQKLRIYMSWAKLGLMGASPKPSVISEVEMELMQVAPEDKIDPIFSFVMGLLSKAKGDFSGAQKLFQKAMSLEPNLIVARREMTVLAGMAKTNTNQDVFSRDLGEVFSSLFKRSK